MHFAEAALFILFLATISVPIANRLRLPLEVFLVIGSCILSMIPGIPSFEVDPKIIFNIFLPLILFYAAYFTSWNEFKKNIRPISLLAFGLVICTTIIVAAVAKGLFPAFSWAEGFLLGAIISPTDAASATSIIKKLGAPRRLITILEGESLVNDATALILFRFSLIAVIMGSFSLTSAVTNFFLVSIGGIGVGLGLGIVSANIMQKINTTTAETTLSLITALAAYNLAEKLNVSGVIATVVCGIYFGIRFPEVSSSRTRIHAKASWDTIMFIINGFVFTLIGLELPIILRNLRLEYIDNLFVYGIIISAVVVVVRMAWVFLGAYASRLLVPSIARKDPIPPWPILFTLGWCGMRGIISLAAALSLPLVLATNTPFPNRDLILFITYCVIVVTLIVPAFSLPPIMRMFKLAESENKMKQEAMARMRMLEGVLDALEEIKVKEKIRKEIVDDFQKQIKYRIEVIRTQLGDTPFSTLNNDYMTLKKLNLKANESEKKVLFQLRKLGEINDEVFHLLLEELDLEELRAKTPRV